MSGVLGNFLGYQGVWWCAVAGAARGSAWPGLATAVAFALWQFAVSSSRRADLQLVCTALVLGAVLDGGLAHGGLLHYAAADPALPHGGAPLWILALWAAFALTVNHSLAWMRTRPAAAALLGALGGPIAYAAAARLGAVAFSAPAWHACAVLAAGWAAALVLLAALAARGARAQARACPQALTS